MLLVKQQVNQGFVEQRPRVLLPSLHNFYVFLLDRVQTVSRMLIHYFHNGMDYLFILYPWSLILDPWLKILFKFYLSDPLN